MATDVLIDSATHEVVDTNPQTAPETPPEPVQETPQDDPAARFEARIRELTDEIAGLRTLNQAQAQRQQMPVGQGFQPKPEYESNDFKQYLDRQYGQVFQQMQGQALTLANQNDLLHARLNVDDTFGSGTWKKYGRQVEDAFQAELAKGTPEPREKIFYRLATEKNWKLTPVEEREERETRQVRRRDAKLAVVPNNPPARRADAPQPAKPMSAMTKEERDAHFQAYIQANGGF